MADLPEAKNKITISWAMLAYIIVGVAMLVSVYWRFVVLENTYIELEDKIEYVNQRIDKKTSRNEGLIDGLDNRINELEKPNTDESE